MHALPFSPEKRADVNGTEFTSKALDARAYWNHVERVYPRPGRPPTGPSPSQPEPEN